MLKTTMKFSLLAPNAAFTYVQGYSKFTNT